MKTLSKCTCLTLIALILAISLGQATLWGEAAAKLPENLKAPAFVEKIPNPAGEQSLFYLFNPPEQARLGVADKNGAILWEKKVGLRPLVEYFWAKDGKSIYFQTDCIQPEPELRSPASSTRSYFFVLESASGNVFAEGNLDTDVLNLPKQLPEAVGASHLVKIEISDGTLFASIDHRGKIATGSRLLSELSPRGTPPKK